MIGGTHATPSHPADDGHSIVQAEADAHRHGLPGFDSWRTGLERRYTVMPLWYWDDRRCRENYISHIRAAIDWQRSERRINRGNAEFLRSLTR
jgi:hypothetical protein